ncbi:MAG: hypothetical protein WEC84_02905, partial [Candidatus Andersenbacteria bacterium]
HSSTLEGPGHDPIRQHPLSIGGVTALVFQGSAFFFYYWCVMKKEVYRMVRYIALFTGEFHEIRNH